MLFKFTKKRALLALSLVAGLAIAGTAFAYFTTTGSGTGSASVGAPTAWKVTTGATTGPALVPDAAIGVTPDPTTGAPSLTTIATGSNVQEIPWTVKNQDSGSEKLANVAISIDPTSLNSGCLASDFSIDGQPVTTATANDTSQNADITAGSSVSGTATIEMIDSGLNQDKCQNDALKLIVKAS